MLYKRQTNIDDAENEGCEDGDARFVDLGLKYSEAGLHHKGKRICMAAYVTTVYAAIHARKTR